MKNIILVAVLSLFVFVACNNAQSSAHTHDDGTTHTDCDHEQGAGDHPEQEAFEVKADSTHECTHDSVAKECEHEHEDGSVHEH
jgi:hypothetical protein